jgi:hypothetical protein
MEKVINTVRRREIGTGFFVWPSCYFLLCKTGGQDGSVPIVDRGNWVTSNHDNKEAHQGSDSVFYSLT